MFLLECPRCKNRMKYAPLGKSSAAAAAAATIATGFSKKVKKCVYCNFSMQVGNAIVQKV